MGVHCLLNFLIKGGVVTTFLSIKAGRRIQGEGLMQKGYKALATAYFSLNTFIPNILVVMLRIVPAGEPRVGKKNGRNWPKEGNLVQRDEHSTI